MRRILGVLLCLGACYSPPRPDCGFICSSSGACPDGYTCNAGDHRCHADGTPPTLMCVMPDAAIPDSPDADVQAPRVIATTPVNNATSVPRDQAISVTYDHALQSASVNLSTVNVVAGGLGATGILSYDGPTRTVAFMPTPPFPAGATVVVSLSSGIFGTNGSPSEAYTFAFQTIDDVAPTLVTSNPLDTATMVPVTSTIVVTFSEVVANVSAASFTVAPSITGTITSGDNITYTFTPSADLPAATVVTVNLTGTIADLAGNPLVPVQFTFTTQ
jgi:Big-like domain-containing protein